jgi:ATP-dependent 26S proteasome regulatory subunit
VSKVDISGVASSLTKEATRLLQSVADRRVAGGGSTGEAEESQLYGWTSAIDLGSTERNALDELLEAGWVELRHDGGILRSECMSPGCVVVPGWRLEAVIFGAVGAALSGAELKDAEHSLKDLVLADHHLGLLQTCALNVSRDQALTLTLVGAPGCGKTSAAHALANAAGRSILALRPESLTDPRRSTSDNLRVLHGLSEAMNAIVLLESAETFLPAMGAEASLATHWRALLESPPAVLVLTVENGEQLASFAGALSDIVVTLAGPRGSARTRLWAQSTAHLELEPDVDLEQLGRRFELLPGAMLRAVKLAVKRASAQGRSSITSEDLEAGAGLQVHHKLDSLAEQVWSRLALSDLILEEKVTSQISEILDAARVREVVFDEWGFASKQSRGRGLSMLFDGEPGTGKTLSAEVIASEMGLPLYRVSMANIMSKWVGETEKNLQRIFHEARGSRSILLFDEADALFSQRVDIQGANDRFANMEVNVLLQLMEGHDGICILTTNLKKSIDKAFERRLSFKVNFPFPEPEIRERLWAHHLPPDAPVADDVDCDILSRSFELSGGSIRNAAIRAAYRAAARGGAIHQDDLIEGAKAECVAAGKLYRLIREDD